MVITCVFVYIHILDSLYINTNLKYLNTKMLAPTISYTLLYKYGSGEPYCVNQSVNPPTLDWTLRGGTLRKTDNFCLRGIHSIIEQSGPRKKQTEKDNF